MKNHLSLYQSELVSIDKYIAPEYGCSDSYMFRSVATTNKTNLDMYMIHSADCLEYNK